MGIQSSRNGDKILVKVDSKLVLIDTDKVIGLDAVGSYVRIYLTTGKKILASNTLSVFQNSLTREKFLRVHNSHIINLEHFSEYDFKSKAAILGDKRFPVSRRCFKAFIKALSEFHSKS